MSQVGILSYGNDIRTLTGNFGGVVGQDPADNINILGASGVVVTGNPVTHTLTITAGGGNDEEMLVGHTGLPATWTNSPTVSGTMTASVLATYPATAHLQLSGTTIRATGTQASIAIAIRPKGTGNLNLFAETGYGIVFRGLSGGWADTEWHTIQQSLQTNDGLYHDIFSLSLPLKKMISIKALINGMQDDYSDVVGGEILITAYRSAIGNIQLVGSPIINVNYTDLIDTSDISASIDVATQSIRLQVVGVAAQNWNWVATISYMYTIDNT